MEGGGGMGGGHRKVCRNRCRDMGKLLPIGTPCSTARFKLEGTALIVSAVCPCVVILAPVDVKQQAKFD